MVAFIASLLITFGLLALLVPLAKRRPPGTPQTWGEAMVAATYAFFLFFWVFGTVPHLWLTWADNELKWRPDTFLYEYAPFLGFLKPVAAGGWVPVTITMQTVRDIIAVALYGVFLAGTVVVWVWWNNRGTRAENKAKAIPTSDYGRPLVRKA